MEREEKTMTKENARPTRVRRVGSGYAAEGRGFYVWDEDPQIALESARELERGNAARSRASRVWLFPARPAATASSEALDA